MEDYIWVTWKDNNSPRYDGKTHKVPKATLVKPPEDITVGQPVTVYWEHSKKIFGMEKLLLKKLVLRKLLWTKKVRK